MTAVDLAPTSKPNLAEAVRSPVVLRSSSKGWAIQGKWPLAKNLVEVAPKLGQVPPNLLRGSTGLGQTRPDDRPISAKFGPRATGFRVMLTEFGLPGDLGDGLAEATPALVRLGQPFLFCSPARAARFSRPPRWDRENGSKTRSGVAQDWASNGLANLFVPPLPPARKPLMADATQQRCPRAERTEKKTGAPQAPPKTGQNTRAGKGCVLHHPRARRPDVPGDDPNDERPNNLARPRGLPPHCMAAVSRCTVCPRERQIYEK